MAGVPGLDGERRQAVAERLWRAWRDEGRPASVLTGFSGVGKTERVVAPLVARAREEQTVAIQIDIPAQPTDLERELLARVKEGLQDTAAKDLAEEGRPLQPLRSGCVLFLPREDSQCSSAGSMPANPQRFAVGLPGTVISSANSDENRRDASARGSRAG